MTPSVTHSPKDGRLASINLQAKFCQMWGDEFAIFRNSLNIIPGYGHLFGGVFLAENNISTKVHLNSLTYRQVPIVLYVEGKLNSSFCWNLLKQHFIEDQMQWPS
jgi:hypothetical protein